MKQLICILVYRSDGIEGVIEGSRLKFKKVEQFQQDRIIQT